MKLFLVLLCVWLTNLVYSDVLTDEYMQEHFDNSADLTMLRHYPYTSTAVYDYTGDCCNNGKDGCTWYRRRPSYSYYYTGFRRRGCYWYPQQSYLVYCLCNQQQVCTSTTEATTTPAPTTTTAAQTTTTAAPTTTTIAPTTTTAAPTTTTTATTTTATTAALRFCPTEATTQPSTRILGGTAITACDEFPGLVSIQVAGTTVCSGVITGPTTLSIPNNCALFANGASVVAQDGTVVSDSISVTGSGSGGPIEVDLGTTVATDSCPGIACVYSSTMANDILLDTCRVAATGFDSNTATTGASFSYLDIPSLQPTSDCPGLIGSTSQNVLFDFTNTAITYNCFISPGGSTCQGDFGGTVVCDLSTAETVVIGQAENAECSASTVVGFYNLEASSVRVLRPSTGQVSLG